MGGLFIGNVQGQAAGYDEGWYSVWPSLCGSAVVGVSIKGTELVNAQQVDIIACGADEKTMEYGFIERSHGIGSVFPVRSFFRDATLASAPAACALTGILRQAGRVETRFKPGIVTAVGALSLTVTERWSGRSLVLPVAGDLAASDFSVDDGVLIASSPRSEVIGWWQTVPDAERFILVVLTHEPTSNYVQAPLSVSFSKYSQDFIEFRVFGPTGNVDPESISPDYGIKRWTTMLNHPSASIISAYIDPVSHPTVEPTRKQLTIKNPSGIFGANLYGAERVTFFHGVPRKISSDLEMSDSEIPQAIVNGQATGFAFPIISGAETPNLIYNSFPPPPYKLLIGTE